MPNLDWTALGRALRISADSAHGGDTPSVKLSYSFLLDNPECFMFPPVGADAETVNNWDPEWPADMPADPPAELIAAYCRAVVP